MIRKSVRSVHGQKRACAAEFRPFGNVFDRFPLYAERRYRRRLVRRAERRIVLRQVSFQTRTAPGGRNRRSFYFRLNGNESVRVQDRFAQGVSRASSRRIADLRNHHLIETRALLPSDLSRLDRHMTEELRTDPLESRPDDGSRENERSL